MKVISVWQPWATLIMLRHKLNETRSFPAPRSLIGTRIGIASTKQLRHEQKQALCDPDFMAHFLPLNVPSFDKLVHGCLLGTIELHSSEVITEELMEDTTDEELAFGWYSPGRYVWRLRDPILFDEPIPVRGQQGIWEFSLNDEAAKIVAFPG